MQYNKRRRVDGRNIIGAKRLLPVVFVTPAYCFYSSLSLITMARLDFGFTTKSEAQSLRPFTVAEMCAPEPLRPHVSKSTCTTDSRGVDSKGVPVRPIAMRKLNGESGQTVLEFAISALVLLLLVFAIIDFSYLLFSKLTLQNAVRQAGRYAITGQSMTGQTRYASILATVQSTSMGLATGSNTTVCSQPSGTCAFGGGPGETVTITVTYPYRLITPLMAPFFPGGKYTITVSTSFKNEPFPPSMTY